MDDLYRDYILEHYRRPHNFGVLDHPTVSHEGANPLCGDRITLMLALLVIGAFGILAGPPQIIEYTQLGAIQERLGNRSPRTSPR